MTLTGNRFQASVSPNRKFTDIDDQKQPGRLTLLTLNDVESLKEQVDGIMERPFRSFSLKAKAKSTRHQIENLNEEDAREIQELLNRLAEVMVPV